MIVVPLGTSAAAPTRMRHLSSMALINNGSILLFDCGEATQLRLMHGGLRHSRIAAIFITHLHGDHYFGLMGLLTTMALARRKAPLVVVGPEELMRVIHLLPGVRDHELTFPVDYIPLQESMSHALVYETRSYFVEARALDHRIFTVGYRVQEKVRPGRLDVDRARMLGVTNYADYQLLKQGREVRGEGGRTVPPDVVLESPQAPRAFAYVSDTRPCEGAVLLAKKATVLVHEATFAEALRQRAHETGHSTAAQAAAVAKRAGVIQLLLSHFSSRYKDVAPLVEEARAVFPATMAAEELRRYPLAAGDGEH